MNFERMRFPFSPCEPHLRVRGSLCFFTVGSSGSPTTARWLHKRHSAGSPEFEQIVRRTDQRPFAFDFLQTAQEEL